MCTQLYAVTFVVALAPFRVCVCVYVWVCLCACLYVCVYVRTVAAAPSATLLPFKWVWRLCTEL